MPQINRREKIFSPVQGEIDRTKSLQKLDDFVEDLQYKHDEKGFLVMVNSGATIPLTESFQIIDVSGTVVIDESKGHFTYNAGTKQMEVITDGYYSIRMNGSVAFGANSVLEITLFKNGVKYSPFSDVIMRGLGATKPMTSSMIMSLPLVAGDVLDIRALVDVAGDVVFFGNNSTFEKKVF